MVNVGATLLGDGRCRFTVWAPLRKQIEVQIVSPTQRQIPMQQDEQGYWCCTAENINAGDRYVYRLDGQITRPDPASYAQPEGVHGPSQLVDQSAFTWSDGHWRGIPLADLIIYEIHVGTFTPEGTFAAVISRLPRLKELGITAIEIMPVAQVPGDRNWGYDGVYPYAVQQSYGGADGLKALVDACHAQEIAVVLDVVYNHLGPEGNYLADFGPYFTSKYHPIWGDALNFDDAHSDAVRNFFLDNALYWLETFHVDILRLDAVHGIYDLSAQHFLEALADRVADLGKHQDRQRYLIAESDLNDMRVIRPKSQGGYGIDAQWHDDFHHALHVLITGEQQGYYQDFGRCADLAKAFQEGFVYAGQYAPHRQRCHGNSSRDARGDQLVVCAQNHDQVGNRPLGDRLSQLATFEGLKLTAGAVLLSPFVPLLFMGEEYGETAPFLYFISHSDPDLVAAVRQSKQQEFDELGVEAESYDPQAAETLARCRLNWQQQHQGQQQVLWNFYQKLIQLRRSHLVLQRLDKQNLKAIPDETLKLLMIQRWTDAEQVFYVMNFRDRPITLRLDLPPGNWEKLLDSAETTWSGPGSALPKKLSSPETVMISAQGFALYQLLH
jgi:maltooligosyltrehalose trehalohydrolase